MPDDHSPDYVRAIEGLRVRVPQLARAIVAEHRSPGSPTNAMPEVLSTTAPHTLRHFLRAFLDAASHGRTLDDQQLTLLAERARDRAMEGVRLDQIIAVHQSAATAVLTAFRHQFSGTATEFGHFADLLQRAIGQAAAVTIQAFQEETQALRNAAPNPREELARRLVEGEPLDHHAIPQDVTLTAGFTVPCTSTRPPGRDSPAPRPPRTGISSIASGPLPSTRSPDRHCRS